MQVIATRAKNCVDCGLPYVGGFRSYRCPGCRRVARAASIARGKQKRRITDGLDPSEHLARIIEAGPKTSAPPRRPPDRAVLSVPAAVAVRIDQAALAAGCNRYAMLGRIFDGWMPT